MSYSINVTFSCPGMLDISFSDVICPGDWSCCNYWDDLGDVISSLIAFSESKISKIFPEGHDYTLSSVNATYLGDVEK